MTYTNRIGLTYKNRRKRILLALIVIFVTSIIFFSVFQLFSDNSSENNSLSSNFTQISFRGSNIPEIETGHYALWGVSSDNEKILLKRFNSYNDSLISLNLQKLDEMKIEGNFVYDNYEVSIEANGDRDTVQSSCILLSGSRNENEVKFNLHNIDLSEISGQFILATPTDGTSNTNEQSGIWFTSEINGAQSKQSLNLPNLDGCLNWSAFLYFRNVYLPIGEFSRVVTPDNYSEFSEFTRNPLNIPGEDFLKNLPDRIQAPINIPQQNSKLFVSIQPREDTISLFTDNKPLWTVLEYEFAGDEVPNQPIDLTKSILPTLDISTSYNF